MQSLLRRVVAGPRQPHQEANLDLCYVTDFLIATSGPSATYPSRAYRNPLNLLVRFLDEKHGGDWAIWEFRAEGTGYPDSEVYGRIRHYPWPDHHPPPFRLIPLITASMRDWLHPVDAVPPGEKNSRIDGKAQDMFASSGKTGTKNGRVVVVHCKAGKGRSGTASISYLMSEEGWTKEEALQRFTERRMRPGFGAGISIPSQLRYIDYAERWTKSGKMYVEQEVEVLEVQIWGLRDGVKVALEGYVDEGRKIKTYHLFSKKERDDYADSKATSKPRNALLGDDSIAGPLPAQTKVKTAPAKQETTPVSVDNPANSDIDITNVSQLPIPRNVSYRPASPILIPGNDVNLAIERRSRAGYSLAMVTSVAHVWFNAFFEGRGPENYAKASAAEKRSKVAPGFTQQNQGLVPGAPWADSSGVFEISWDAMDGIKGSSQKGVRAFDKVAVVWRIASAAPSPSSPALYISTDMDTNMDKQTARDSAVPTVKRRRTDSFIISQPAPGEPVPEPGPAAWDGPTSPRDQAVQAPAHMATGLGVRKMHKRDNDGERVGRNSDTSGDEESIGSADAAAIQLEVGEDSAGYGGEKSGGPSIEETESDEEGVKGIRRGVVEMELEDGGENEAKRSGKGGGNEGHL